MEPCISEYGVMGMDDQRGSLFGSPIHASALHIFKEDVYGFGVILLELVTGKLVKGNGQPYSFLLCWCDMNQAHFGSIQPNWWLDFYGFIG